MKNRTNESGGAEFGVILLIAIVAAHVVMVPIFLAIRHAKRITVHPGQAITLPAAATDPFDAIRGTVVPLNESPMMAAAAVPAAGIQPASESTAAPLLIMCPQGTGRLLLIATKRGVVQRDSGGGWEFFDVVNRVPWYWDLENTGEACVMFRLVDAD